MKIFTRMAFLYLFIGIPMGSAYTVYAPIDAGGSCDASAADSRCPAACANTGGKWTSNVENQGWLCLSNVKLGCDCTRI